MVLYDYNVSHVNVSDYRCFYRPDDDEDEVSASCAKISQFFAPKTASQDPKKHRYFEERGFKNVLDF